MLRVSPSPQGNAHVSPYFWITGHSSGPNLGTRPRRLFIAVYSAEDAIPLSPNPLPSKHEGLVVRGEKTGRVRSTPFELKLPQRPTTGSFFNQQVGYDG